MAKNSKSSGINLETKIITFCQPSSLPESISADGEVNSFINVPYLAGNADESGDSGSGVGSGTSSGGTSSGGSASYRLRIDTIPAGVNLPAKSRLLCVHAPASFPACRFYICLQSNGFISAVGDSGENINIAYWPSTTGGSGGLGRLKGAYPHGDVVTLIGERGMAWLVFDSEAATYSLQQRLPEELKPMFTMTSSALAGYCSVAGQRPRIQMSVELPDADEISEAMVANWISGDANTLPEAACVKVFEAVGKEVERYVAAVKRAGLLLTPVKGMVSLYDVLPSRPIVAEESLTPTLAIIDSHAWHAGRLNMELSLTMLPMSVMMSVAIGDSHRGWQPVFSELRAHLSEEVSRFVPTSAGKPDITPYAISRTLDSDGKRYPCFAFHTLAEDELKERIEASTGYQTVFAAGVKGATKITANLKKTADESGNFTPQFTPHFEDQQQLIPKGASLTDDGVILYGGSGKTSDESETFHELSFANSVMTPMPGNGVIYREVSKVGELPVMGIAMAGRQKGSAENSRHPLYAFSEDGVRLLTSDKNGVYGNARLVEAPGITGYGLCAETESGVVWISKRGVNIISNSSKISDISGLGSLENARAIPDRILYDVKSDTLLLIYPVGVELLDIKSGKRYLQEDLSLNDAVEVAGAICFSNNAGKVQIAEIARVSIADGGATGLSDDGSGSGSGLMMRAALPADLREDESLIITRALKLGNEFERKRVVEVDCGIYGNSELLLEGSDKLDHWHRISCGRSPLLAIHSAAWRYHRVTLRCATTAISGIRRVRIRFRQ